MKGLFHAACAAGHVEVAKILLAKGARIDAAGKRKVTPLMVAAAWGRLEEVKLLLAAGADPMLKDAEGRSAIDLATAGEHADVAAALKQAATKEK